MKPLFDLIFEDHDLLVINKPAGLVCHPTKIDEYSSLIGRVRLYLGNDAEHKPPHLVNRLDRETSGVTILAKNPQIAGQLGKLFETRAVQKEYLALVHGAIRQDHGIIEAPLGKDEVNLIAIKDCVRPDGAPACTEFWVERRTGSPDVSDLPPSQTQFSILRIRPHTGRKHQIRIHLAHIGHPIVGDKLYGGDEDLYLALVEDRLTTEQKRRLILPHHALHAREIQFCWHNQQRIFRAEPPTWLSSDFRAGIS